MMCCALCEDMIPENAKRLYYDDPRAAVKHLRAWFFNAGTSERSYIMHGFNMVNVLYHLVRAFPHDLRLHTQIKNVLLDIYDVYEFELSPIGHALVDTLRHSLRERVSSAL